jgi:hypothetical protein
MTQSIANHHCANLTREETQWAVFDQNQEYRGHVFRIAAWAIPSGIHVQFNLPNHIDLYITSEGQWAQTLEIAEHLLTTKSAPAEFVVKGALLALFIPGEWAIDNGDPNPYSDYQICRDSVGYWNALEIEQPVLVGNLPDYD